MNLGITQLNFELKTKTEVAIEALRQYEPPEGYYLADSGGKDSTAVRLLTKMSGVKFDAHYCVSPIDPPQVYKFLKEHHPDTQWDYHARGFWKMVVTKGLPMRQSRWCCELIKEGGGTGRVVISGVRRSESAKRSKGIIYEPNYKHTLINLKPINDWSEGEVWEFLREHQEPYCELYDLGFTRIGCVMCPMGEHPEIEAVYFPKIANLWLLACNRLVNSMKEKQYKTKFGKDMKHKFTTGQELYDWWTSRT